MVYCKKCGTKQKEGQKFCPKCGTPYPVIEKPKSVMQPVNPSVGQKQTQTPPPVNSQTSPTNGQATPPPPMNNQKPTPPPVNNLTDKAEETFEQGKKYVKENVQPQLDKGIEKLKSTDWKEKVNQATDAIKKFDVKKVKTIHWIYAGVGCVALFIGGLFFSLFMFIACNSCGHSSSLGNIDDDVDIEANSDQDMETLAEMARIRGEIKSIFPSVDALYRVHQLHMAQGRQYATSPAWGKWQDYNKRIDDLWDDYIRLAQKLSGNNDEVVKEARESKRKMDNAFMDMFGPHY